jgi:hypothetical protein
MGWVAAVSLLLNDNFVRRQATDIARVVTTARSTFPGASIGLYARGDNVSLAADYSIAGLSFFVLEDGFVTFRDFFDRPRSMQSSFELKKDDRDRTTAFDREIPFTYFAFGALQSFDIPDLLAAGRVPGLVVNPVNGDWERADVAACRKLLPNNVRVTSTRQDLREFLR